MLSNPPLPFPGNKRNFKSKLIPELKAKFSNEFIFVDLFGGSGYLSYITKQTFPEARVIYNDYDYYINRLSHINETNKQLKDIKGIIGEHNKNIKLDDDTKDKIINYIKELIANNQYIDYITISSYICFSNNVFDNFEQLIKAPFYNRLPKKELRATDYLEGLEIVHLDYKELIDKYKNEDKIVFYLDPPYLASEKRVYGNKMWDLKTYLDLFKLLHGAKYWVFFTNGESFIIDLLKYMDTIIDDKNKLFKDVIIYDRVNHNGGHAKYTDIMIIK